jgi:signal transduction histidine kinase
MIFPNSDSIYDSKILIVDDNIKNVHLLECSLKQVGYTSIHYTTDSREAADLYRSLRPDLVLLDLQMPHLDGYDVLKQLKEIEEDYYAPVMVLTAQSDMKTRIKALEEGALDFLTKPFDQLEIRIRIKCMLQVRRLNDFAKMQNTLLEEKVNERTVDLASANLNLMEEVEKRRKTGLVLKRYTEELEIKNQELKDFVFIASHDLQEPLRRIVTFGDLLRENCKHMEETSLDYLDRMQKSSERMKTLIEDLLQFCQITQKETLFQEKNLDQVVQEVLIDLEDLIASSKARIKVQKLPVLKIDSSQIRQLFQNLIGNAIKYRKNSEAPLITLDSRYLNDDTWEIVVEDNGIGFNEKHKNRIFRPFERLHGKGEFEGNGIGLTICRNIVQRHGGTIQAESEPGKGTKFIITLPAKPAEHEVLTGG